MDRCSAVLFVCATITSPAHADVYAYVTADGSLLLTNIAVVTLQPAWVIRAEQPVEAVATPAPPRVRDRYQDEVQAVAREYAVDSDLIHAVIATESNYVSNLVSRRGAVGLMQLMPRMASKYGIADAFDAIQNLRAGAQHLRHLLTAFDGDIALVLAAYNAGEPAVRKYGRKVPPFPETINFVRTVQGRYRQRKQVAGAGLAPP